MLLRTVFCTIIQRFHDFSHPPSLYLRTCVWCSSVGHLLISHHSVVCIFFFSIIFFFLILGVRMAAHFTTFFYTKKHHARINTLEHTHQNTIKTIEKHKHNVQVNTSFASSDQCPAIQESPKRNTRPMKQRFSIFVSSRDLSVASSFVRSLQSHRVGPCTHRTQDLSNIRLGDESISVRDNL